MARASWILFISLLFLSGTLGQYDDYDDDGDNDDEDDDYDAENDAEDYVEDTDYYEDEESDDATPTDDDDYNDYGNDRVVNERPEDIIEEPEDSHDTGHDPKQQPTDEPASDINSNPTGEPTMPVDSLGENLAETSEKGGGSEADTDEEQPDAEVDRGEETIQEIVEPAENENAAVTEPSNTGSSAISFEGTQPPLGMLVPSKEKTGIEQTVSQHQGLTEADSSNSQHQEGLDSNPPQEQVPEVESPTDSDVSAHGESQKSPETNGQKENVEGDGSGTAREASETSSAEPEIGQEPAGEQAKEKQPERHSERNSGQELTPVPQTAPTAPSNSGQQQPATPAPATTASSGNSGSGSSSGNNNDGNNGNGNNNDNNDNNNDDNNEDNRRTSRRRRSTRARPLLQRRVPGRAPQLVEGTAQAFPHASEVRTSDTDLDMPKGNDTFTPDVNNSYGGSEGANQQHSEAHARPYDSSPIHQRMHKQPTKAPHAHAQPSKTNTSSLGRRSRSRARRAVLRYMS